MHFDFVDIGTCDFETGADEIIHNNNYNILLVEPLKFYLDELPSHQNIFKLNKAIGNKQDIVDIFYVEEELINQHNMPKWLKGCNSVEKPHTLLIEKLSQFNVPLSVVKHIKVEMITFDTMCQMFNIESIGKLKIDTEGYDHIILKDVYRKISKGFKVSTIIFEYQEYMNNTHRLDALIEKFLHMGYRKSWPEGIDIQLDINPAIANIGLEVI